MNYGHIVGSKVLKKQLLDMGCVVLLIRRGVVSGNRMNEMKLLPGFRVCHDLWVSLLAMMCEVIMCWTPAAC